MRRTTKVKVLPGIGRSWNSTTGYLGQLDVSEAVGKGCVRPLARLTCFRAGSYRFIRRTGLERPN
jgi:hypothetical protein